MVGMVPGVRIRIVDCLERYLMYRLGWWYLVYRLGWWFDWKGVRVRRFLVIER
jgi:hypothetical protein